MSGPWEDYRQPSAPAADDGPWKDFAPAAPPKSSAIRRGIGDTALSIGQGAVGAVKALADATGANNRVSRTLGDINEGMAGLLSPERQAEIQNRARLIEEADKSGSTFNEVTSRLGGFVEAPVQTVAQGIGSLVPTLAGALATRGRSAGVQFGANAALGSGIAVGGLKGQNYDAVLREATARGLPPAEAEALAQRAAEYSLENAPQQLLAGGLGALAATTGAERLVRGVVSGDGLGRRVVKGALAEGLPEGAQGAQAQFAQNVALNNAGFQTDTSTGVLGEGLLQGAVGGVIGAGFGVPRQQAPAPAPGPAPAPAPGQPPAPPGNASSVPPAQPEPAAPQADAPATPAVVGPLTSAVAAMGPRAIDAMPPLPTGQAVELAGQDAARVQREASRPAEPAGATLPTDITRDGKPFTSMESATRALARAGAGFELARVAGGLVVRQVGTAPVPAQRQQAAQGGPLSRFTAENAEGADTLSRGVLDPGFDVQELPLEQANALADNAPAPAARRIPAPKATELDVQEADTASLAPAPPEVRREPRTPKPEPTRGMTDADVVQAYVEQRRKEGTLAGRRFAGDFDAGRITPDDVLALVRPRAEPTPDERLAAAAAQRQAPAAAPGLVDAAGRPIPTTIRERREQQRQPDVPAATPEPVGATDGRGDNAGRGVVAVGSVPAAPGRVVQPAARAGAGSRAPEAVANGDRADPTLRARPAAPMPKQSAAAPAQEPPPQGRAPEAAAPSPQVSTRTDAPPVGGFDAAAWDKAREDRIKASREAGNTHLDTLDAYVETMRGKRIRSVHDPKVKGTIFTVDNGRNVFVDWADGYSQEKEGAAPMQYGRRKVMQSTLGPRDLKDYVLDEKPAQAPAPAAPTKPPSTAEQTRPEGLIALRRQLSVLKQLLTCLG